MPLQCDESLPDMVTSIAKDSRNLNLNTQLLGASELILFICINYIIVLMHLLAM